MIPNNHGVGRMVRTWNEAVSTSQDLSRAGLHVDEEVKELLEACESGDRAAIAKEACDVVWTAVDVLIAHGIDFHGAFTEVTRSNWTKVGPDREIHRHENGKVAKGPHYQPPRPGVLIGERPL